MVLVMLIILIGLIILGEVELELNPVEQLKLVTGVEFP